MRRFLIAATLACVLSVTALAGEMPIGGFAPPPPSDGSTQTTTVTAPGEVPTIGAAQQEADASLGALLSILRLLVF